MTATMAGLCIVSHFVSSRSVPNFIKRSQYISEYNCVQPLGEKCIQFHYVHQFSDTCTSNVSTRSIVDFPRPVSVAILLAAGVDSSTVLTTILVSLTVLITLLVIIKYKPIATCELDN